MSDWRSLSDDELRIRLARHAESGIAEYLVVNRDDDAWSETITYLMDVS